MLNFSSNKKLYSCQFENCARWIVVKCCIISRTKLIINIRRYLFLNIASKKKIYKNRPRSNNDNELKIPISLISKKREKQFPHPSCNPPKSLLSRTNLNSNSVLSVPSSSKFRSRENAHARSSRNRILLPRLPLPRDGFRRISLSLSLSRGGGEEYPGAGDLHAAA